MTIKIGNKDYKLVAERLVLFWKKYPDLHIETNAEPFDSGVIMRARIVRADGGTASIGHAYAEVGNDAFKALEKAESCAVGRALAFLDEDLMGSEIASADELSEFTKAEIEKRMWRANREYMDAFLRWRPTIEEISDRLADNDFEAAKELMFGIPNEDKLALNRAWTKGGPFTPHETKQIKWWSNDFELERGGK